MSVSIPNILKTARPHFKRQNSNQEPEDKFVNQIGDNDLKSKENIEKDSYNQISSPCSTRPSPSLTFNENEARSNSEESVSFERFKLDERNIKFEDLPKRKLSEEHLLVDGIENYSRFETQDKLEPKFKIETPAVDESSSDQKYAKDKVNQDFSFMPAVPHIIDKNGSIKSRLANNRPDEILTKDLHANTDAENGIQSSKLDVSRAPIEISATPNNDLVNSNFADGIVDENFDATIRTCKIIKENFRSPTNNEMDTLKTEKFRISEDYARLAKQFPYVAGVYFDRYQQRWSVNWNESGRRIAKYFPVKTYGFETAYKLAVECREQQKIPQQALDLMNKSPLKRAKFNPRERKREIDKNSLITSNSSADFTAMTTCDEVQENSDNSVDMSEDGSNLATMKSSKSFDDKIDQWRSALHNTRKRQIKVYPKNIYEEKLTNSNEDFTNQQGLLGISGYPNSNDIHNMSLRKKSKKLNPGYSEDTKEHDNHPLLDKSIEKKFNYLEDTGDSFYLKPELATHKIVKPLQSSSYETYDVRRKRRVSDQENLKFSKEIIKEALSLPRVPGVWFDKVQCRWACNFVERKRRRAKYFPVKDYGVHNGRKMAIETRLAFDKSNNSNDSSSESNTGLKFENTQSQEIKYWKDSTSKPTENRVTKAEDYQDSKHNIFTPFSLGAYTTASFEQLLLVQKLVILGILRNLRNICLYNLTSVLTSTSFQRYYMLLHSHVKFIEKATSFSEITPFLMAFIKCIEENRMPGEFPIEKQIELVKSIQDINLNSQNYQNYNDFSDNDSISNGNMLEDTSLYLVQGI